MKKLFFTILMMLLVLIVFFASMIYLHNINTYILIAIIAVELCVFHILGAWTLTQVASLSKPMENIIEVLDTDIKHINKGREEALENSLIYRDKSGEMHTIDFAKCANNFQIDNNVSSTNCIGERNIVEGYFLFYTSGIKTRVVFKKIYVWKPRKQYLFLKGTRNSRFLQLQNIITDETKYTTYDMT